MESSLYQQYLFIFYFIFLPLCYFNFKKTWRSCVIKCNAAYDFEEPFSGSKLGLGKEYLLLISTHLQFLNLMSS